MIWSILVQINERTLPKDIPNLGSTDFKSEPYLSHLKKIDKSVSVVFWPANGRNYSDNKQLVLWSGLIA